ncbi:DUF2158 domain-containing protein [Bradyrhizobium valentinum]|uniref:DUF2158 domain-containing protein n=1 Tax=Bradyrhizobium valentinum TaxID=1518501 RepID=UPI0012E3A997|nr:DUF2158 domain-containing protein [Bradyrhizobium valentinum]
MTVKLHFHICFTDMEFNMLAVTTWRSIAIALTLGGALGVPLSAPAFSETAPSNPSMQNKTAPALQGGDLVRLRSGGPLMIVDTIRGDQVDCYWADGNGQINAETFPIYTLRELNPPPN